MLLIVFIFVENSALVSSSPIAFWLTPVKCLVLCPDHPCPCGWPSSSGVSIAPVPGRSGGSFCRAASLLHPLSDLGLPCGLHGPQLPSLAWCHWKKGLCPRFPSASALTVPPLHSPSRCSPRITFLQDPFLVAPRPPLGSVMLCVHCSHSTGSPRVREPSGPGSCPALPSSVAPVVSAAWLSSLERSKPSTSVCRTKLSCLCSRQLRNTHYAALKFSVNSSVA